MKFAYYLTVNESSGNNIDWSSYSSFLELFETKEEVAKEVIKGGKSLAVDEFEDFEDKITEGDIFYYDGLLKVKEGEQLDYKEIESMNFVDNLVSKIPKSENVDVEKILYYVSYSGRIVIDLEIIFENDEVALASNLKGKQRNEIEQFNLFINTDSEELSEKIKNIVNLDYVRNLRDESRYDKNGLSVTYTDPVNLGEISSPSEESEDETLENYSEILLEDYENILTEVNRNN